MEIFKRTLQIDFLSMRYKTAWLSLLLFIFSLSMLKGYGLQWGLDFTGGTQAQIEFKEPHTLLTLRQTLQKTGFLDTQIQSYGSSQAFLLTQPGKVEPDQLSNRIQHSLPHATIQRISQIGPQAGQALLQRAIWAFCIALLGIMIYVALRFEYRLAIGAIIALIHDPILILGIFAWQQIEVNLIALAAILTVLGYSLNNIIVIFDRIRENFRRLRHQDPISIVNLSINETLSRTLITSGITLAMVLILYIFGGPVFHSFSLALAIGIIVGEYSAIYIASALAISLGLEQRHMLRMPSRIDDRP